MTPLEQLGAMSAALSKWISGSSSYVGLDDEAHLWRRCMKPAEEVGEVYQAISGMLGENPRKGVTNDRHDLIAELLDVAGAAMAAVEYLIGNTGQSYVLLDESLRGVVERAQLDLSEVIDAGPGTGGAELNNEHIAHVAYEAIRALAATRGEAGTAWDEASPAMRANAIETVERVLDGMSPGDIHDRWVAEMTRNGWSQGERNDLDLRTHPHLVDYVDLPPHIHQQDRLFAVIVTTLGV